MVSSSTKKLQNNNNRSVIQGYTGLYILYYCYKVQYPYTCMYQNVHDCSKVCAIPHTIIKMYMYIFKHMIIGVLFHDVFHSPNDAVEIFFERFDIQKLGK